jgi:formamidopyrimidine-DNA glycosylase
MPELPEVETVRRGLVSVMLAARFMTVEARRGDLRWPLSKDFVQRLEGRTVERLERRAKYLLADLSSGDVLIMHLGMSGSFRIRRGRSAKSPSAKSPSAKSPNAKSPGRYFRARAYRSAHDHVNFLMSSGALISFNDPRRFGMMKVVAGADLPREPLLKSLGPEPLANEFDAGVLARLCKGKRTSLKAALSDQRIVAGLGNIYVCEALHRARLSPKRRASTIATRSGLPNERARALVDAIKAVLRAAIEAGGSSLRNHRRTDGALGEFQHNFRVYDRAGKPCPTAGCSGTIRRIVQTGRSTFFCPVCQK